MTMSILLTSRTSTQESHREREGGHVEENDREPATVSESVPVRPETSETSAQSAVVPVVTGTEEFVHKEPDNGLCKHIEVL